MAYKVDYKIVECMQKKNSCYRQGITHKKVGIIRHNTGAGNPYLKRYVDDPERLGKNAYGNHWNQTQTGSDRKMVHYFIGLDKNNVVRIYHIMPDNYVCWGNGSHPRTGKSCNRTHIQYEICDDGFKSKEYFEATHKAARYLEAYLCVKYGWSEKVIMSHWESYLNKCGSAHGDDNDWLKKFGTNMDEERAKVKKLIKEMKEKKNNDEIKTVTKVDKDKTNPTPPAKVDKDSKRSKKEVVKALQTALNKDYTTPSKLAVDGNFGARSTEKVKAHNIQKGSKGEFVKWLQIALNELGYKDNDNKKLSEDKSFGEKTKQAVLKLQAAKKLSKDGVVGVNTVKAILNSYK